MYGVSQVLPGSYGANNAAEIYIITSIVVQPIANHQLKYGAGPQPIHHQVSRPGIPIFHSPVCAARKYREKIGSTTKAIQSKFQDFTTKTHRSKYDIGPNFGAGLIPSQPYYCCQNNEVNPVNVHQYGSRNGRNEFYCPRGLHRPLRHSLFSTGAANGTWSRNKRQC